MGPIATLDSASLAGRDYLECFAGMERRQILSTINDQRRRERLAGRLAAKFLFLNRHSEDRRAVLPPLMHLTPVDLDRFTASEYRAAEVFRRDEIQSGLPRVGWSGGDSGGNAGRGIAGQNVAITHSRGVACAFLGTSDAISLDMEQAEPRTQAFYNGSFTPREAGWAAEMVNRVGLDLQWTFTFLWTVKECLLKTQVFGDLSIADLPSMDVRICAGENQLVHPYSAREFLAGFVFLKAEVADRSRHVDVKLAVSGRHDLILTALLEVQRRIA